jgi:hypothetical protein
MTSSAIASSRPTQAAAMVAVAGRPVSFHTTARSILPPSSGSPGSRLKMPTMMLATISCLTSDPLMPLSTTWNSPHPAAPSSRERAGPAADTRNSLPGVCGSLSISEMPPSGYSRIRRTGSPKPSATTEWLSSCTRTDTYSRITKAAATTYLLLPCSVVLRSLA